MYDLVCIHYIRYKEVAVLFPPETNPGFKMPNYEIINVCRALHMGYKC